MTDSYHVFLSYSSKDVDAAVNVRAQLDGQGLSVFRDAEEIRRGDLWLERLQQAVDACGCFVVLVGRDGVARWIGAEIQAALNRHFGAHDDTKRLPIFPILLGDTSLDALPAFLRLFQATPWNGTDPLPVQLLEEIRNRTIVANRGLAFEGCPFVGLDAYRADQAQLFFGRQQETLDVLACFDTRQGHSTVRWLEINGNSGSGKSSLMNAGLLPLVDQGWLWPRTGHEHWRRIGMKTPGERSVVMPMMPGQYPVRMLAEQLAGAFGAEMTDVRTRLERGDERALTEWLRTRKQADTAFLLAIDQFEELFTFADPDERARFDRLLAAALDDADCPLFVISTVRSDFLDRFEADLPRLVAVRNRVGKAWTLPPIDADGLREVIAGPARLAALDVSEVREAMVAEARDEPGALPLVENALHWLWQQPRQGSRLSGQLFTAQGGLAGILSQNADDLLNSLGTQRERALELLFGLVKVDPESRRHARRRIPFAEAVTLAGGGTRGHELVSRLAGERARDGAKAHGPLRLITVTAEAAREKGTAEQARWVNLIHETLVRSKGMSAEGKPQPYWPTLWHYIEQHQERAARSERLQLQAREWKDQTGLARLFGLAGWVDAFRSGALGAPGSVERRYLRWSQASASVQIVVLLAIVGLVVESLLWASVRELPAAAIVERWAYKLGKRLPVPELKEIPAGRFQMNGMGEVAFATPFYLAATEVTFAEFDAFVVTTDRAIKLPTGNFDRGDMPIINVSWDDAKAYADSLSARTGKSCRLPSEAEWEYACKAGTNQGLKDFDLGEIREAANCVDCSREKSKGTTRVRTFKPNDWGLYDMHGNVWEWASDCLEGTESNCTARALRGGSWSNDTRYARCGSRFAYSPGYRGGDLGFRVLCSSPIVEH